MFRQQSLILVICLFVGASLALKLHATNRTNVHIQKLEEENRELAATHPDTFRSCFDFYSPKLNAIVVQYASAFEYCTSNYTMAKDIINRNYLPSYYYIGNQLKTSCIHIVDYQIWTREQPTLEELVNRLDYISADSAQSSKTFYGISANATEVATQLEGEYLTLNTQKDICLNNAEVKYVTETADTYDVLNACLRGENNKVIDV